MNPWTEPHTLLAYGLVLLLLVGYGLRYCGLLRRSPLLTEWAEALVLMTLLGDLLVMFGHYTQPH